MPRIYTTTTPEIRFWPKVDKSGDCWLWTACLDRKGYGRFGMPERGWIAAHRYAYILANGPIPDGLHVLHRCDNRRCVNPDHLWLGTNADNVADRVAKGRTSRNHVTPEQQVRGERHGMVRLREADVIAIREAVANGVRQCELAARYDVSRPTINLIVKRKNWRHVP